MNRLEITTVQLRSMIGLSVRYEGRFCRVIEVLDEGPSIILETAEQHRRIQPDQHGEAHRKVPLTYLVEILSADQLEFSASFLSIEPLDDF